jgi:hypothetical protein
MQTNTTKHFVHQQGCSQDTTERIAITNQQQGLESHINCQLLTMLPQNHYHNTAHYNTQQIVQWKPGNLCGQKFNRKDVSDKGPTPP